MTSRYGSRGDYRYDDREDDDRYGRGGYDAGRGRYGRGAGGYYGETSRRFSSGRDFDEEAHSGREYGGGYGGRSYEGDYGGRGIGGGYDRGEVGRYDYGRDRARGFAPREYGTSGSRSGGEGGYMRGAGRGSYGRGYDREDDYYGRGSDYGRPAGGYGGRTYDYERGTDYDQGFRGGYSSGRDYDTERYNYGFGGYSSRGYDRGESRGRYGRGDERADYRGRVGYGEEDRGWFDRAADEVRSWFGDEEAERRRRMDEARGGGYYGGESHRGRGPKNYRRSDERIREDVSDRLGDNDWVDASEIDVSVSNGEVTLSGTVDSRYTKRLAEDLAESCSGVTHVQNNLRVRGRESRDYGSDATTTAATTTGTSSGMAGGLSGVSGTTTGTTGTASATGTTEAGTAGTTGTGGTGRAARTSS